jgi:hypothetical protein
MQTDLLKGMLGGDKGPPTPPGIRMHGIFAAPTGFSVEFFQESAILGCGPDAARAYPYTVVADGSKAVVKIDGYGLLRPDKIGRLLFRSFAALEETGRRIAARLPDCPAQGVPFTAALEGSRLLSWGVDPPKQNGVLAWQERESWRMWIMNRVAVAMIGARQSQNGRLAPWRFALERLRLDAIDTDTWTPLVGFGRAVAVEAN